MTSGFAHSYIQISSIGNYDSSKVFLDTLGDILDLYYEKKIIDGYQTIIIESKKQEEDEIIPINTNTMGEITLQYPYLFIRIQPVETSPVNIDLFMKSFGADRIQ